MTPVMGAHFVARPESAELDTRCRGSERQNGTTLAGNWPLAALAPRPTAIELIGRIEATRFAREG